VPPLPRTLSSTRRTRRSMTLRPMSTRVCDFLP
jgi:hypothetical protein